VVCGAIPDCDDDEDIAARGDAQIAFLRRCMRHDHGVSGGRRLTIRMNRINPVLFAAAFAGSEREGWPGRAGRLAIDGKGLAAQP